jgi:ElaB/YqjD/DUF883 family membrane-anchored ribosome-binding protein
VAQTTSQLTRQIEEQRSTLGYHLDELGDKVSPRRMTERRKAAMRDRVTSIKDRVMGTASSGTERASELKSEAMDAARHAPEAARQQVEGNPLAAGVLAFAAGLVVAALIPETPQEQEWARSVQPHLESAASEVGSVAQDSAAALQPKAREAAEHVKQQAQDSASTLKDDASDTASSMRRS